MSDSLIWPLSGSTTPDPLISSPFGPRWQASQSRYDYHSGLDIVAPPDTPVHVITDGIVYKVGWLSPDSGLTVLVSHTNLNLYSAYLHLNGTAVITGEDVTQGQVIGYVGNTGTTEFYHLHFEIRLTASGYPTSTHNPMGYLPRPDVTTPTIRIVSVQSEPIYSPTTTLVITTSRAELDLNQVRVTLQDQATAAVLDDQLVDFNYRIHTGSDTLNQDGIQLIPARFNTRTVAYALTATFYSLHGYDSFTLTAQAVDLAGHTATAVVTAADTTPPGQVTSLHARRQPDSSVELSWVAPGDSGSVGRAMTYEVRYTSDPLNWGSAPVLPNPPTPIDAGLPQVWAVPGPLPDLVYFALRAADDEGNWSPWSNTSRAEWDIFLPLVLRK